MAKVIMDDVDIVNIAQLCLAVQNDDPFQKEIVRRMSDRAADWYIRNMVPTVGRPKVKARFEEFRK